MPFLLLTGILEEGQLLNKNLDAKKIAVKLRTSVLEYKNLRTHDMVNLGNLRMYIHMYFGQEYLGIPIINLCQKLDWIFFIFD